MVVGGVTTANRNKTICNSRFPHEENLGSTVTSMAAATAAAATAGAGAGAGAGAAAAPPSRPP